MKSLYDHIKELKRKEWDYYYSIDSTSSELECPFISKIDHNKFIRNYFKRAGKGKVIKLFNIRKNDISRADHSNMLFLLGIIIYKNTDFNKKYNQISNDHYHEFSFIWFLTALFHDYAFDFENDQILLKKIPDFDSMLDKLKIKYSLIEAPIFNNNNNLVKIIKPYYNYKSVTGKVEHGVLAGVYLYDRLVKNRKYQTKIQSKQNSNQLIWHSDLDYQYAVASTAIALHNIWKPDTKQRNKEYKDSGLENLTNSNPANMDENPLYYLLGIVDTIDPIKIYKNEHTSVEYILHNIIIGFEIDKITICVDKKSELNLSQLYGKAKSLMTWLYVDVNYSEDHIIINLNI